MAPYEVTKMAMTEKTFRRRAKEEAGCIVSVAGLYSPVPDIEPGDELPEDLRRNEIVAGPERIDDEFSLARRDRDAWAAIRGYVYQVDMTILRWLTLGCGEVLELECGEDVDLLAPMIAGGGQSIQRTLEQF